MCDPSQEPIPLKVWNRAGEAGILVAANIDLGGATVRGTVSPLDVPGLVGERFVVYEYFSRTARIVERSGKVAVSLEPDSCALYAIVPLGDPLTPIGLADKYVAPAALVDWLTTKGRATFVLLDGGLFAWVAENAPEEVRVNGEIVAAVQGNGIFTVDCSEIQGTVWVEITQPV